MHANLARKFLIPVLTALLLGVGRPARADALTNWTALTFPPVSLSCFSNSVLITTGVPIISRLGFFQDHFLAVGTGPCSQDTATVILRSADGTNWAKVSPTNVISATHYNGFFGLAADGTNCVGVGWGGYTAGSGNGQDWSAGSYAPPPTGLAGNLNDITRSGTYFVAVGYNGFSPSRGVVAFSTNGLNWNSGFVAPNNTTPTNPFIAVASGRGPALGTNAVFALTTNAVYRSTGGGTAFILHVNNSPGERLITFGHDRFIRAGVELLVSTNSTNWHPAAYPTAGRFDVLKHLAGTFVASAGRDLATSTNGFDWRVRTNALPRPISDLVLANGLLVAAGITYPSLPPYCPDGYCGVTTYFVTSAADLLPPAAHPAPWLTLTRAAGSSTLFLHGVTNRQYDILISDDVTAANWPAVDRITVTNVPQPWLDPHPPEVSGPRRYYRARLVP